MLCFLQENQLALMQTFTVRGSLCSLHKCLTFLPPLSLSFSSTIYSPSLSPSYFRNSLVVVPQIHAHLRIWGYFSSIIFRLSYNTCNIHTYKTSLTQNLFETGFTVARPVTPGPQVQHDRIGGHRMCVSSSHPLYNDSHSHWSVCTIIT